MKPTVPLLVLALAAALSACTSQRLREAAYNSMQLHQREECNKIPAGPDREQCLGRNNTSYDQYQRDSGADKQ